MGKPNVLLAILLAAPAISIVGVTWWKWLVGREPLQKWTARNYALPVGLVASCADLVIFYCKVFQDRLPILASNILDKTAQLDPWLAIVGLALAGIGNGRARGLIALSVTTVLLYGFLFTRI